MDTLARLKMNWRFRLAEVDWGREWGVYMLGTRWDGRDLRSIVDYHVSAITIEPKGEGEMPRDPSFRLTPGEVQDLMDELWRNGIRPSSSEASSGQVEAMQAHLDDMRMFAIGSHEVLLDYARGARYRRDEDGGS